MWCGPLCSRSAVQRMNEKTGSGGTLAVSVPGGELIGVRSGSGGPLLVLHGGPGVNDYSDWFAAELAARAAPETLARIAADDRAGRRASGLARGTGLPGGCAEPGRRPAGLTGRPGMGFPRVRPCRAR